MKIKNYSELRENLASLMDEAVNSGEPILITRPKDKHCILISYAEYRRLNMILEEFSKKMVTQYAHSATSAMELSELQNKSFKLK